MKRELIKSYCKEVLDSKQDVKGIINCDNHIVIEFEYDENYIYQEDTVIHIVDLISFVYSKV